MYERDMEKEKNICDYNCTDCWNYWNSYNICNCHGNSGNSNEYVPGSRSHYGDSGRISDAFIRARITVSPQQTDVTLLSGAWKDSVFTEKGAAADRIATETTLYDPDGDGIGWYQGADGWYYYNSPIAPGQNTGTLFDAVKIGEVTKNFDITVYQEAVFAENYHAGEKAELNTIQDFFAKVTK